VHEVILDPRVGSGWPGQRTTTSGRGAPRDLYVLAVAGVVERLLEIHG